MRKRRVSLSLFSPHPLDYLLSCSTKIKPCFKKKKSEIQAQKNKYYRSYSHVESKNIHLIEVERTMVIRSL
jgi:hypothetical protein